jgi:hypothetical protein
VNGLRIEDSASSVVLTKQDGKWVLPDEDAFPADRGAVDRLLDQLAALEKGWPVATTAGAAKRFKVDDTAFERRLTLLANDEVQATLYVGTSPGFRKVHVRPAGADAVYAVAFNTWEASATADDWIDKDILKLDVAEVERVALPSVVIQRDGETLRLAGLTAQEQDDAQAVSALVGRIAGMRVQSVLGTEARPEYGQDTPALALEVVRKGGGALTYRFSKPKDATYYVLKRSDLDQYFEVAEFVVEPIKEAKRDTLVEAPAAPASKEVAHGEGVAAAAAQATPVQGPQGEGATTGTAVGSEPHAETGAQAMAVPVPAAEVEPGADAGDAAPAPVTE